MQIQLLPSFEIPLEKIIELHKKSNLIHFLHGIQISTAHGELKTKEELNRLAWNNGTKKSFCITKNGELCGRISFENSNSESELFFWLVPEFRRQGIMTQAFKLGLLELENMKSTKTNIFNVSCIKQNAECIKFLTNFGFKKISTSSNNIQKFAFEQKT